MAESTLSAEPAARSRGGRATGGRLHRLWRAAPRAAAAVFGGVLVFLAFPPVGAWPLAPAGAGVVALVTYRRSARSGALLGFLAGLGLFLPLLTWMGVLGVSGVWVGLAILQALYFAPLGAGLALVTRLPGWPVATAGLWVAEEAVRGRFPFGGLPWGRLAFSQGDSAFTPYASLAGAPFVTFLVALAGGLVAWALLAAWRRRVPVAATVGAAAIALPALGYAVPVPADGRDVTVAAVQGNVPRTGLGAFGQRQAVLNNHVEATHRLADAVRAGRLPNPDLVVWPENASDLDPYANPRVRRLIDGAVRDVDTPVLVGAMRDNYTRNIGIAWDPDTGPGETYTKRHLVAFGEYIPFRDVLTRYIDLIERLRPRDIVAGTQPGSLTVGGIPIADAICFDVAYDNTVREAVNGGSQLLVVQTNNATFGGTAQPEQQLAIERLRAVEHGRSVVVAATSGISAIISPSGQVLDISEPFTQQLLVERVPLRGETTLADRLGAIPEWVLAGGGVLALGVAAAGSLRARNRSL